MDRVEESVSRPPGSSVLHGVVESFWVSVRPDAASEELVLPSGQAQLVIDGVSGDSLLVGPRSRPTVVPTSRFAAGMSLGPVGLFALSTIPPRVLVDDVADDAEAFGRSVAGCLDESDPSAIIDRLEQQMLGVRRDVRETDQMVVAAERLIRAGSRLGTVGDHLGVDRRLLVPAFRDHVGLAPKQYQRLLRFQNALRSMRVDSPPPLAVIAARCGYADQAHLTRDFKEFSGLTPGQVHGLASKAHNHLSVIPDDPRGPAVRTRRMPAPCERGSARR